MAKTSERYDVMEFYGKGDPMFGGSADDRPLGKDGAFLTGCYSIDDVAEFATREEARAAGERASNRRQGGKISVLPGAGCRLCSCCKGAIVDGRCAACDARWTGAPSVDHEVA